MRPTIIRDSLFVKPDSHGNIYLSARSDTHWWIWKWAKIHYLPFSTNALSSVNVSLTRYKSGILTLDNQTGVIAFGNTTNKLDKYPLSINPSSIGIDNARLLYINSSNRLDIYSLNGPLVKSYKITNEIIDGLMTEKGYIVKTINKKGYNSYVLHNAKGVSDIKESDFTVKGWAVDRIRIPAPDGSFDVAGIDIKFKGKSVRQFKYGEKDTILTAKVLDIDEMGFIWLKVVYRDGLDGSVKGEILKFNAKGDYQNRIYLDQSTSFEDPRQDTVVMNEETVYQVNGNKLIKYEKEKIVVPGLDESRARVIDYLNKKAYTGNKMKYTETDMAVPFDLEEDLMKLDIDFNTLLVNEIYARKGMKFNEELWKGLFGKVKWYKIGKGKVTLSGMEKSNAEMLGK